MDIDKLIWPTESVSPPLRRLPRPVSSGHLNARHSNGRIAWSAVLLTLAPHNTRASVARRLLLVKVRNGQQAGLSRTAWLSSVAASWIKLLHFTGLESWRLDRRSYGRSGKAGILPERHMTEALN